MFLNDKRKVANDCEPEALTPAVRLERRTDGRLWLGRKGQPALPVRPIRCFPWTSADGHISLRDDDDEEVGYVTRIEELDTVSRVALSAALLDAGLLLRVTAVEEVEEDYEIRCWKVQTAQGPRAFQTRLETWPRPVPGGGLLLEDVAGDLFWFPEPKTLDAKSQKLLWAYID